MKKYSKKVFGIKTNGTFVMSTTKVAEADSPKTGGGAPGSSRGTCTGSINVIFNKRQQGDDKPTPRCVIGLMDGCEYMVKQAHAMTATI